VPRVSGSGCAAETLQDAGQLNDGARVVVQGSGLSGGVTVDLVGQALTEIGSLRVDLGVGDVAVSVPEDMRVRVDSQVGVGRIAVDGRTVDSGFGLRWSEPQRMSETVVVDVRVGMGAIEVRHG